MAWISARLGAPAGTVLVGTRIGVYRDQGGSVGEGHAS